MIVDTAQKSRWHPSQAFMRGKQHIRDGQIEDFSPDFGGRRVEIVGGGTGTFKFSIFTKRVHFWASLVRPRLP